MTYFLDSSAILRYTDDEAGGERIEGIFQEYLGGTAHVATSALHWGEVAGKLYKMRGGEVMNHILQRLQQLGVEVIPATGDQAVRAAILRADHKIPYVDAFGVVLSSGPEHIFVTADFDFKAAATFAKIEFLPAK